MLENSQAAIVREVFVQAYPVAGSCAGLCRARAVTAASHPRDHQPIRRPHQPSQPPRPRRPSCLVGDAWMAIWRCSNGHLVPPGRRCLGSFTTDSMCCSGVVRPIGSDTVLGRLAERRGMVGLLGLSFRLWSQPLLIAVKNLSMPGRAVMLFYSGSSTTPASRIVVLSWVAHIHLSPLRDRPSPRDLVRPQAELSRPGGRRRSASRRGSLSVPLVLARQPRHRCFGELGDGALRQAWGEAVAVANMTLPPTPPSSSAPQQRPARRTLSHFSTATTGSGVAL